MQYALSAVLLSMSRANTESRLVMRLLCGRRISIYHGNFIEVSYCSNFPKCHENATLAGKMANTSFCRLLDLNFSFQ